MMIMQVRERRRQAGITQRDLASKIGVTQSAVAQWEREEALPSSRQLPSLARALGCSISDLFEAEENEGGEAECIAKTSA